MTHLPNMLVIGAGKAGTTSLWHYLKQHPQVFMHPRKQLNFFWLEGEIADFNGPGPRDPTLLFINNVTEYSTQFSTAYNEIVVGEASNSYLYSAKAAKRIWHYVPHVKLVAILRDPAERAYSRYLQLVQTGRERETDFESALNLEEARVRDRWWPDFHYVRMGRYYDQLEPYLDLFPMSQIKIYLHEDLHSDPLALMQDLFRFLDVDPAFIPDLSNRYSVSGISRNRIVHTLLSKARAARPFVERNLSQVQRDRIIHFAGRVNNQNLSKPPLLPELRLKMIQGYRDDTLKLQDIIQRDLSAWIH